MLIEGIIIGVMCAMYAGAVTVMEDVELKNEKLNKQYISTERSYLQNHYLPIIHIFSYRKHPVHFDPGCFSCIDDASQI